MTVWGIEERGRGIEVLRDVLSLFWKEMYDSLFIGENERMPPSVRHDYCRDDWKAIARVSVKGYLSCQYLPVLLSKTFLAYVLFGECVITDPMLIQSFKHYISADERSLIDKCVSGAINIDDADESSDLLETLSNLDCRRQVTKENIMTSHTKN